MLIRRNNWDLLDDFFETHSRNEVLKTDIKEEEHSYVFTVEVPGVNKENVNIQVKNGYLNISVTRSAENKVEAEKYLRQEIRYGEYSRSFYIGDIELKDINAKCSNGILTITVPKVSKTEDKKLIEIDWQ